MERKRREEEVGAKSTGYVTQCGECSTADESVNVQERPAPDRQRDEQAGLPSKESDVVIASTSFDADAGADWPSEQFLPCRARAAVQVNPKPGKIGALAAASWISVHDSGGSPSLVSPPATVTVAVDVRIDDVCFAQEMAFAHVDADAATGPCASANAHEPRTAASLQPWALARVSSSGCRCASGTAACAPRQASPAKPRSAFEIPLLGQSTMYLYSQGTRSWMLVVEWEMEMCMEMGNGCKNGFGENLLFRPVRFGASDFIARVQLKGPSQGGGVRGESASGNPALCGLRAIADYQRWTLLGNLEILLLRRYRPWLVTAKERAGRLPQALPSRRAQQRPALQGQAQLPVDGELRKIRYWRHRETKNQHFPMLVIN
ncbi:hypothetical protein BBK36DRAFT_1138330 [Trichoderma citrinoviride]|uniref:Uncharacterized protein n=1 Tax=Trichoderma citrinoviride TaxID=58853 RepID=A0A2T4BKS7_9HYPO|nr:hypothetical protein BBK36DRAFT_1138330 [Trichoderma citrinoviride]PTB69918.1 hypothetical protein BBK36DRAFT_1138330 [Trichoderma citrinoviride]